MKKHLSSFRKGWQGENLARYILSNFAFISQPSTVADDLGSDFLCTMFEPIPDGKNIYLVPKEPFAIQIKSNRKPFDITSNIEYLKGLEIPFFVGVCNQKNQVLELYSGEYLIPFFVDKPSVQIIRIILCESSDCRDDLYFEKNNKFTVKFPRVANIGFNLNAPRLKDAVKKLSRVCRTISRNITRRNKGQYIFYESLSNKIMLVANKQFIKESIDNRLGEVFFELAYVLEKSFIDTDLEKYNRILDALKYARSSINPIPGDPLKIEIKEENQ